MKNNLICRVLILALILAFPAISFSQTLEWSMFEDDEEEDAKPVLQVPMTKKTGGKVTMSIKSVYPGMVRDEVRGLLGDPDETLLDGAIWHYSEYKVYIKFDREGKAEAWQQDAGAKCRYCGETMKVVPVVYGALTPDLLALRDKKEIIEGGRYSTVISPHFGYMCRRCEADFSTKDPSTRVRIEIRESLKYRPPGAGAKIKDTKRFEDQLKMERDKDE